MVSITRLSAGSPGRCAGWPRRNVAIAARIAFRIARSPLPLRAQSSPRRRGCGTGSGSPFTYVDARSERSPHLPPARLGARPAGGPVGPLARCRAGLPVDAALPRRPQPRLAGNPHPLPLGVVGLAGHRARTGSGPHLAGPEGPVAAEHGPGEDVDLPDRAAAQALP